MTSSSNIGYIQFALRNRRLLAFGFLMALGSSFGQTFFIGIFTPSIEASFGLSHSQWGSIYMAGTLMSAAALTFTGRWIDHLELRTYALLVCVFLTVACAAATFSPTVWFLIPMIFLLRQAGQGLASHTAVTGMVKYFRRDRGKAVALATLGFPMGRALLPVAAVALIATIGWRETYAICAVLVLVVLMPLVAWLLTSHARWETTLASEVLSEESKTVRATAHQQDRSLRQVLRDPIFYLFLPAILAPSFFDTALSFHLLPIAALKLWSAEWVTTGYAVYAATTIMASMWIGTLVDKIGAVRLYVFSLAPYVIGTLVLGFFDHAVWAWVYLGLYGIGSGMKATLIPVFLSELYGTRNIGAIRSFVATLSVFASALGPPALGFALDLDVSIMTMTFVSVTYFVASSLLMIFSVRSLI
jgi:MFS family permease